MTDNGQRTTDNGLLKKIRSASSSARLAVSRTLGLRAGARVAELLVARDPLLGDEPLEHQLARGNHGARVLFRREADLVDEVEQAGDDGEALEADLRPLV